MAMTTRAQARKMIGAMTDPERINLAISQLAARNCTEQWQRDDVAWQTDLLRARRAQLATLGPVTANVPTTKGTDLLAPRPTFMTYRQWKEQQAKK